MCAKTLSELERGRSEADHTVLKTIDLRPYLSPTADTPLPLRYMFYLLGNVHGKVVLDVGCGSGENVAPLLARGAHVIAVDLSHDLVQLAVERVRLMKPPSLPRFLVGSAYDVPLAKESVDIVFCASLLHHLDIPRAMDEIRRVVKPGGTVIVKEPVRFSQLAARLRRILPAQRDTSDNEHPLTRAEVEQIKAGWQVSGERAFRLPFVPLFSRNKAITIVWATDRWLLKHFPTLENYSTSRVMKLEKTTQIKESPAAAYQTFASI